MRETGETATNTEGVNQWNPFALNVPDRSLIGLTVNMRNSLFFNRNSAVWDFELGQIDNQNRVVLITGFEARGRREYFWRTRWNVTSKIAVQNWSGFEYQKNNSEAFLNRNFEARFLKLEPELTVMPRQTWRFIVAYKLKKGINELKTNGETLEKHDFSLETTWNQSVNAQLRARMSFVDIKYVGEKNTPIEFALLEGLQNGRNLLWNLSLDRVLSKNIFLNVSYEGRQTGLLRTVHVGRAAVRAQF
ncbi:MAG: hypothetical protein HC817_14785 [Saprospiraceae bacterium]|nr:hypothetical protein [Saprospiraceae bacterium]